MDLPVNQVVVGDCREVMSEWPEDSIDFVMFSPPYWGLRNYGENVDVNWSDGWRGQLGLEPDYRMYVQHLVEIGKAIKRVLRDDGSWYLNLGDTYAGSGMGRSSVDPKWKKARTGEIEPPQQNAGIKAKCKMLMPYRVALALIDDGWICRNDIVWVKKNPMPSSVKDRLNTTTERVFHFVQRRKYYYDLDAIRVPTKTGDTDSFNLRVRDVKRGKFGTTAQEGKLRASKEEVEEYEYPEKSVKTKYADTGLDPENRRQTLQEERDLSRKLAEERYPGDLEAQAQFIHDVHEHGLKGVLKGKNPGDVLELSTKPFPEAHFSVYPPELTEKPIKSSCPPMVCAECGKPYKRITETRKTGYQKVYDDRPKVGKAGKERDDEGRIKQKGFTERYDTEHITKGWKKTCNCSTDETRPGIVLDPMCGAGSTLIEAKRLGRNYIGIEINPDYAEIARKRLKLGDEKYKQKKRKKKRLKKRAKKTVKLETFG